MFFKMSSQWIYSMMTRYFFPISQQTEFQVIYLLTIILSDCKKNCKIRDQLIVRHRCERKTIYVQDYSKFHYLYNYFEGTSQSYPL